MVMIPSIAARALVRRVRRTTMSTTRSGSCRSHWSCR